MEGFIAEAFRAARIRAEALSRLAPGGCRAEPRRFKAALEAGWRAWGLAVVAEYKRCSPSAGFIAYLTPQDFLEAVSGRAEAVSVLTEPAWFCGSPELLALLSSRSDTPVLAKDFIVAEAQLEAYACLGASAALIIDWPGVDVEGLALKALELGLDPLIEVVSADAAVRWGELIPEAVIGVNSRDLATLRVDFEAMLREVMKTREVLGPRAVIVAESGVDSPGKALRAARAGATAILVGTAVMRNPQLLAEIKEALAAAAQRSVSYKR